MRTNPFSLAVGFAFGVTFGFAGLWAVPANAQAQADKKADAKKPAAKPADDDPDDLNKKVDDALKQLEKLTPPPAAPQPRFNNGGAAGNQEALRRALEALRARNGGLNGLNEFGGIAPRPANAGRFGIVLRRPAPELVEQLKLPEGQGIVVGDVRHDSAAAKAGFQKNDIILELDGKPAPSDIQAFQADVRGIKAGTPIDASILRGGQKQTIKGIVLPEAANNVPGQPQPRVPQIRPGIGLPGLGLPGVNGFGGLPGGGLQVNPRAVPPQNPAPNPTPKKGSPEVF